MSKNRKAAALSYDPNQAEAPKLVAKGSGTTAEQIIELAKAHDIPIQEDGSLVELLSQLNINETIPEDLYQAVAEIFSFIYMLDRKLG